MQTVPIKRSSCFVGLILAVVSVASSCSSAANKSADTSVASALGTTTTVGASVTTVGSAGTTIPPTSSTSAATTIAETATTVAGILTPARDIPTSWIAGAQPGDPVVNAAPGVCQPFFDGLAAGPYTVTRCGVWSPSDGQRTWTVTRDATGSLVAIIWQQSVPNTWIPVLRMRETTPSQWSDITILTGNTDSGPNDELVSGVRIAGVSKKLAVAVVDIRGGNPRVVAVHPTGLSGVAVLRPGIGVEVWSGVEAEGDPKCCPTNFAQSFLVAVDGAWYVQSGATVPAGDPSIPASEV